MLLVAGLRRTQRAKLAAAGIRTIEQLAERRSPVPDLSDSTFVALRRQAAMPLTSTAEKPSWELVDAGKLRTIPAPDAGDIFFDFEGDPLHQEATLRGRPVWGLDYLFGLVEPEGTFRAFWAHPLAEEKQALAAFLDYVTQRRAAHPGMHIYHYASYERSHLLSLAARHGVGEEIVDDLLRNNVLVDLYPIVRHGLRIGSPSYSLKKLEPLYMGDAHREGVDNAGDSIAEYVRHRELVETGAADDAAVVLADIERYNTYDCISTLRLRDWLLEIVPEGSRESLPDLELPEAAAFREPSPVYLELQALLADIPLAERTADDTALALASAAIDYHRREAKSFWWEHFSRLSAPIEEWADTRGVVVIETAEVMRDWHREGRQKSDRRHLLVTGTVAPGTSLREGDSGFYLLYDEPHPPILRSRTPAARSAHKRATILEIVSPTSFLIEERLGEGGLSYDELPMAITPAAAPDAGTQVDAIAEWGQRQFDARPVARGDLRVSEDIPRLCRRRGHLSACDAYAVVKSDTALANPRPQPISRPRHRHIQFAQVELAAFAGTHECNAAGPGQVSWGSEAGLVDISTPSSERPDAVIVGLWPWGVGAARVGSCLRMREVPLVYRYL